MIKRTDARPATRQRLRAMILEPSRFDVSKASRHGTMTYIFGHDAARPALFDREYRDVLQRELERLQFDPDTDFFVATGAVAVIAVSVAELVRIYGRVKLLCFDARDDEYVVVDVGPAHKYASHHAT